MRFGIVYRRLDVTGLMTFIAAQIVLLAAGASVATGTDAWRSIGHFSTVLSAAGLTGGAALLAGGFATIRRRP